MAWRYCCVKFAVGTAQRGDIRRHLGAVFIGIMGPFTWLKLAQGSSPPAALQLQGGAGRWCRGPHVFGPLVCSLGLPAPPAALLGGCWEVLARRVVGPTSSDLWCAPSAWPHFPAAPRHGTFAWCFLAWAGPSRGVARAPGASLLRGSFALLSPLTLTSIARPGYYLSCQGRPTASSGSDSHQRFWLLGRLALRRLPRGGGRSRPLRGVGIGPRGCPGVLLIVGCSDSADAAALLAAASARRPTRGHRPMAHRWAARGSPWQSTLRAAMTGNVLPLPASAPLTAFSALSQDARPACLAAAAGPPIPLWGPISRTTRPERLMGTSLKLTVPASTLTCALCAGGWFLRATMVLTHAAGQLLVELPRQPLPLLPPQLPAHLWRQPAASLAYCRFWHGLPLVWWHFR